MAKPCAYRGCCREVIVKKCMRLGWKWCTKYQFCYTPDRNAKDVKDGECSECGSILELVCLNPDCEECAAVKKGD